MLFWHTGDNNVFLIRRLFCTQLIEFAKVDDSLTAQIVRSYEGGTLSVLITKSKVYADPNAVERKALIFGADEAAKGTIVWDSTSSQQRQVLKAVGSAVVDMELLQANEETFTVAMLTDKKVLVFEKSSRL